MLMIYNKYVVTLQTFKQATVLLVVLILHFGQHSKEVKKVFCLALCTVVMV